MNTKLHRGRCLIRSIPGLPTLLPGDRLTPSPTLLDIGRLEETCTPLEVVFWRPRRYGDQLLDSVYHRCPLFDDLQLGTSPHRTVAIDSLHSLNYGPMQRWCSAALWRLLLANPWRVAGDAATKLDVALKRLSAEMTEWFIVHKVPADRRISELTVKMLGPQGGASAIVLHTGTIMKVKAAEIALLLPFALTVLQRHRHAMHMDRFGELYAAGVALADYCDTIRYAGMMPTLAERHSLMHDMTRHLLNAERALIKFTPKHHLVMHLTFRIAEHGNPRNYSCWVDEGLNLALRCVAQHSHRSQFEYRIFSFLSLRGQLDVSCYFFGLSGD
jgi:hypothetical protein